MGKATLVIMAAGIGSRFGGGIKQLEPVGPNGEIIIDYSIYDALEAGFDKVVFVIRKSLEKDFKDIIGRRIEDKVNVEYVFQEIKDIPEKYKMKFNERMKPWGTGQAILCCKNVVKEPFLVINADDYYGKEAYKKAFDYLTGCVVDKKPLTICMIGFILKNTLSNNGGVTRGVCKVSKKGKLTEIEEIPNIRKNDKGQAVAVSDDRQIDVNSVVSMNMWGLTPAFIDILENGFADFLDEIDAQDLKVEYLLPTIIGGLLEKQQIEVDVLESQDRWFGVTYKEDKEEVVEAVKLLIDSGDYDIRI